MELHETVKKRYILSLNGDEKLILADAASVLSNVSKKQFQDEISRLKSVLPSAEVIAGYYSSLPEPEKSEKIRKATETAKARRKAAVANYTNCCSFLFTCLDAQIEALQYYGLPLSGIEALAEAKASGWYTRPRNKTAGSITHIEKTAEQVKKLFYDMPDSTASHFLFDILSAGSGIADLPPRKRQVNHSTAYDVKASGDKRLVSMETREGAAQVTVEISDINKMNKAGKKFLILSLIKANEQALHNGQLTREYISFPLQELVDYGLYARLTGARKGFEIGTDALTSIKVKETVRKSKNSTATIKALEVPFTGAKIENNQCYIYLNTRIDWNFLT